MIFYKLNFFVVLGCLLERINWNDTHVDAFHINPKQHIPTSSLAFSSIPRTTSDRRRRCGPSDKGNSRNRLESMRRFYQSSNEEHMNVDVNVSIRDVRTGFQGKPASSSAEDLELTRKIIMNKWDIELTRQIIMGATNVETNVLGVDVDVDLELVENDHRDVVIPSSNVHGDSNVSSEEAKSMDRASELPMSIPPVVEVPPPNTVRRASIRGVSISPSGFLVLAMTQAEMEIHSNTEVEQDDGNALHRITLPMRITSNTQDAIAATSAESLTMCQLLSGIDMAGTIFKPEVLQDIVGIYCSPEEDEENDDEESNEIWDMCMDIIVEDELGLLDSRTSEDDFDTTSSSMTGEEAEAELRSMSDSPRGYVRNSVQTSLATLYGDGNILSYQEANRSQRSNIPFPKLTLDSVTIDLPLFDGEKTYEENRALWKDAVLKEEQRLVESSASSPSSQDVVASSQNDRAYSQHSQNSLIPLPLQFVLECRVDGDKTLHVPIYTQIATIQHNYPHLYYITDNASSSNDSRNNSGNNNPMERCKEILQDVLYDNDDECSGAFVALALALRYKCPIGITSGAIEAVKEIQSRLDEGRRDSTVDSSSGGGRTTERPSLHACMMKEIFPRRPSSGLRQSIGSVEVKDNGTMDEDRMYTHENIGIENRKGEKDNGHDGSRNNYDDDDDLEITCILPQYKSASSLQSQSQRVVQNVEQGFRLSKLQGALKIAIEKGDTSAEEKIRAEIKKLVDNM